MKKSILLVFGVLFFVSGYGQITEFIGLYPYQLDGDELKIQVPENDGIGHLPEPVMSNEAFRDIVLRKAKDIKFLQDKKWLEVPFKIMANGKMASTQFVRLSGKRRYSADRDPYDLLPDDTNWYPLIHNGEREDVFATLVIFSNPNFNNGELSLQISYHLNEDTRLSWRESFLQDYVSQD